MLPFLNSARGNSQKQVVAFRGINYSEQTQDGELRDALNLSARKFPFLSTRRARRRHAAYSGATAMTARGELIVVEEDDLLLDGVFVGKVTPGDKQFAIVNTKLVIWPDQVYLDVNTKEIHPLGAELSGKGATFTTDTMTVDWATALTKRFKVGDCVTITGTDKNDKDAVIKEITGTKLKVMSNGFAEETVSGTVKLERRIPQLDFICESENRLWGCSSESQTIYASALGDPTNFFVYEGTNTDSYAVGVGTGGEFTGCCKLTSSVLFWKEDKLHKMLGSYPAEYSLFTYEIEGLRKGCQKSMQVINEVLYYMGLHGIYAYSGGMPSLISASFGEKNFSDGVAGTDGDTYYLSVLEGDKPHLLLYETRKGMWIREDDTRVVDFARSGKELYLLDTDGIVWLADGGTEDMNQKWMAQFTPFYEGIQGRKRYTKLILRVEVPKGAWMQAEMRQDGGSWRSCGKILGRDMDAIPLLVPINRCDKFEVRLSGAGPCVVKAMMLEYQTGSDV